MIGCAPTAFIGIFKGADIELGDNFHYKTGKMIIRKPLLDGWWQEIQGLPVAMDESSFHILVAFLTVHDGSAALEKR